VCLLWRLRIITKRSRFPKKTTTNKNNTIKQLEEMIKSFQQKCSGTSSEKNNPDQLCLFNEAEEMAAEKSESVE